MRATTTDLKVFPMKRQCCVLLEVGIGQLSELIVLVLLCSFGLSGTVHADGHTFGRLSVPANGVLSEAHMIFPQLDLQVGLTKMKEVRVKLGSSKMPRGTDGNDEVCYVSKNPNDRTLVLFGTHDFVGRDLLAFVEIMTEKNDFPKTALCGQSALISKDLMTKSGLRLGLTKDQVKVILGPDAAITGMDPDTRSSGNYVVVDYERLIVAPFPLKKDKGKSHCYGLFTTAEARFEKERAVSVMIKMHEEGAGATECEGYDE